MAGQFFDPTPVEPHQCPLPEVMATNPRRGWRCDCGKAYVVETLPARDVNPGELPYQWRRAPEHDQ